ncbi:hypothetical protein [Rhodococcus sp. A5(2022)]|uniref:Uncharacterized protein n=1 Tax=Rhodococcus ruber TaxID=1830 RepID=A0A098BVX0_9NOCA|nr:hypothetical protein [Rhodococcus sp. A5(2022)]MCZ1071684.1 hypothetical protein [Rhodococcus sp. A5(2022)]CDZ92347.1 hypothetical protein RHRU231_940005 [Rhodococcus ruber]
MRNLDPRIAAAVEREVAKAPRLTDQQLAEITALLRTGTENPHLTSCDAGERRP